MIKLTKSSLTLIFIGIFITFAAILWWSLRPSGLPPGIVAGNGRIEATEIDIATKAPGRIIQILAKEGDFVQAESAYNTALAIVAQRESEQTAAKAMVEQRRAELDAAKNRMRRSQRLVGQGAVPQQQVDDDRARVQGIQAAVSAALAQVAAAHASIEAAKSQVIQSQSVIEAVKATVDRLQADINDSELKAPLNGRVQYRIAEPGEVLGAGGRLLSMVDLTDVYMTFFLPTEAAGKVALGSDIRLVLDALPNYVIPAKASFVASVAQFTPKTVETESERLKLMFRVRARIDPHLLKQHIDQVKTGVPGMAYVKLDPAAAWPTNLEIKLPK